MTDDINISLLAISEHTHTPINNLIYNITTLELFSIWNAIIRKVEIQEKAIEDSKK